MRTLRLTLAYDGMGFDGWQVQPNRRTVQQTVQQALHRITGKEITVIASGRTDAGVHALGQVVGFRTASTLTCDVMMQALNAHLPQDVVVLSVMEAEDGFHPIRDAERKTYRYVIRDGQLPNLFCRGYCWHVSQRLNVQAMQSAAQRLLGTHDFSSFESAGSKRVTSIRTIFESTVRREQSRGVGEEFEGDQVVYEVTADGFFYNMVRAIVGTLYDVGRGAVTPEHMEFVLQACDRKSASMTAPPLGLFLVNVKYPTHGS